MPNKLLYIFMSVMLLFTAVAAFIGGMFLNQRLDPGVSISVTIVPATELPRMPADITGSFIEQRDNAILLETKSLQAGGAGPVSGTGREAGPNVELIITSETMIYRETTQLSEPLSGGNQVIQQTVQQATLDDLDTRSMVMAWGRRSGDRLIADVLMYSNIAMIKHSLFDDCDVCP